MKAPAGAPNWETSAAGPFDRWANGLGFDYFYGFNAGDMNHWDPVLFENRNLVPRSSDPNYYLTEDIADHAISWVRQVTSIAPDKPFFLYVAPGANHSPHPVPQEWIDQFKGQFDAGWDAYREASLKRQKKLGVVPENTIDFAYQGKAGERGKPATVTLTANGKKVGEGRLPRTVPLHFSLGEGVDVGTDTGSAVDFTYTLPFQFTGTIDKVTVTLK